jgi:hypothetical protein
MKNFLFSLTGAATLLLADVATNESFAADLSVHKAALRPRNRVSTASSISIRAGSGGIGAGTKHQGATKAASAARRG